MATKVLQKTALPGALLLRTIISKFDALRYLPKLAYGFLQFNSAGDLVATDAPTVNGTLTQAGLRRETSVQNLSGAGAVDVTHAVTKFTSTGGAQALTLANGVDGQIKTIVHVVDGGSGVLTPTTKTGFSTITFTAVGDAVILQYFTTLGWMCIGVKGATFG